MVIASLIGGEERVLVGQVLHANDMKGLTAVEKTSFVCVVCDVGAILRL